KVLLWEDLDAEVQAVGAKGKDAGSRVEMVEGFLFDRVDAEARGAAVGGEHHAAAFHLAHEAKAALALVQLAVARAEIALHAPVGERVPPAARVVRHSVHFVTR